MLGDHERSSCSPEQVKIGEDHVQHQGNEGELNSWFGYERILKELGYIYGGNRKIEKGVQGSNLGLCYVELCLWSQG